MTDTPHTDVLIVGSGIMGSAVARLLRDSDPGLDTHDGRRWQRHRRGGPGCTCTTSRTRSCGRATTNRSSQRYPGHVHRRRAGARERRTASPT
ncbi:hypothetical protein ACRAWF_41520 [Streptomyces sp. L7]